MQIPGGRKVTEDRWEEGRNKIMLVEHQKWGEFGKTRLDSGTLMSRAACVYD